jgi:hypothetical protein
MHACRNPCNAAGDAVCRRKQFDTSLSPKQTIESVGGESLEASGSENETSVA